MEVNFVVVLCLYWFQIMAPKAASEPNPADGTRGKSAGAESKTADVADDQRVYGGNETLPHEFPYHILVTNVGLNICGGVIIDTDWAVTAGHCVGTKINVSWLTLSAGKHDKTISESTEQLVGVVFVLRHPDFTQAKPSIRNDITLMKVSPPFQFNEYVQKVALPKRRDEKYLTGQATAVGWGNTETTNFTKVTTLRKVSLPLMANERCQELYQSLKPGSIFPVHICAGGETGKDTCGGDSGGPLLFMEEGRQVLIGLTSWGRGCGRENLTGVYTRVTEFVDWIENVTGLDFSDRADTQISVVGTSRGTGIEEAVRAKISNGLAQTMCKGFDDYQKDKTLSPAFKVRPKTPGKCGWAIWSRCQVDGNCKPYNLVTCKV